MVLCSHSCPQKEHWEKSIVLLMLNRISKWRLSMCNRQNVAETSWPSHFSYTLTAQMTTAMQADSMSAFYNVLHMHHFTMDFMQKLIPNMFCSEGTNIQGRIEHPKTQIIWGWSLGIGLVTVWIVQFFQLLSSFQAFIG